MTPLSRLVARHCPRPLCVPLLALLYTALFMGAFVASRHDLTQIIYVDVRGKR